MKSIRDTIAPHRAARGAVVAMLTGGALGVLGCQVVLGIHDVSRDPTGGDSAGNGGAGPDGGGQGGNAQGSFTFAIKTTRVNVPYGGLNYVDVEATRIGGFDSAIDVSVQGAPAGLVAKPLTIASGSTTGKLEVGAEATLVLGTAFELSLLATSGGLTQTAKVPAVVTGKPGTLDESFGQGGITAGPSNSGYVALNDIREVAEGKILVGGVSGTKLGGGTLEGMRLLASGAVDTSFNGTGFVQQNFCGCTKGQGGALGVAREIDGLVIFVGWGNAGTGKTDDIYLFRYRDNGALDGIQSDNGINFIDLGGNEDVLAMELAKKTGAIVVSGAKDSQVFVAQMFDRYSSLDTQGFATPSGWLAPDVGATTSGGDALAIDAMGRILVAGWAESSGDEDVLLFRLTQAGALDATFGTAGVVKVALPGSQRASAVIVEPDGGILVAADTSDGTTRQLLLQRFVSSGALDPAFGDGGQVLAPLGGDVYNSRPVRMARLLDGRIVVAGTGAIEGTKGPVLERFLPDGSPDPTFGSGGAEVLFVGNEGQAHAIALTTEGKLLVAGSRESYPFKGYVARVWN
jgi:uncharacterized delta-60 repeat protein